LLRHRQREKREVKLRMHTKLEHLLFRSMWKTYFCVRFESRNGRSKLLQSFWYTLYR
jgi:membrane associated rhomboid family serine protease